MDDKKQNKNMSSENALWGRQMAAKHFSARIADGAALAPSRGGNAPVSMRIRYTGKGTPVSVTVTTATNVVLVSTETAGTTTVTCTFATAGNTTVGGAASYINSAGAGNWKARVVDDQSGAPSASHFVTGAVTAGTIRGQRVWDLVLSTVAAVDAAGLFYNAYKISYDRAFDKPNFTLHRVSLYEVKYYATFGTIGSLSVIQVDPVTLAEEVIYLIPDVNTTLTTVNFGGGLGWITADEGKDLLVKIDGSTSLAAGNYMNITGLLE
jgi:hypothetical protein